MSQNAQENSEEETGANISTLQFLTPPPSTLNQETSLKLPTRSALRSGWSQYSSPSMSKEEKTELVKTIYGHFQLPDKRKERNTFFSLMQYIKDEWILRDQSVDMDSKARESIYELMAIFNVVLRNSTFDGANNLRARTIAKPVYFRDGVDEAHKIMQTIEPGTEDLSVYCEAYGALCEAVSSKTVQFPSDEFLETEIPSALNQASSPKSPTESSLRSASSPPPSPSTSKDENRKLVKTLYGHLQLPDKDLQRYELILFMNDLKSKWTLRDKKADMESNDFKVVNKLTKDFEILRTDFTFNGADNLRARTIVVPTYFRDGVDEAYKILQTREIMQTVEPGSKDLLVYCEAFAALCEAVLCEYSGNLRLCEC